ncbi:MAG: transglutaminase family protein [Promethearchaeota archaeon]
MRKSRLGIILVVLLLLLIGATLPPRVSAFNYVHYWRINFAGSIEVTGNESMPITPYWNYIGNTSWQTCELLSFEMTLNDTPIVITGMGVDIDGNPRLTLNLSSGLQPEEVLRWDEEWLFTVANRRPALPPISELRSGRVDEIENLMDVDELLRYTQATTLWKRWNSNLTEIAELIRDGLAEDQQDNVLSLLFASIQWIQNTIIRSGGVTEPQYPEETIMSQIGDCDDQSNLLIVLLRIFNIPCYLTTGHWFQDGARTSGFLWGSISENAYRYVDYQNSVGHGWAMVFVPPWGWLPFDLFALEPGSDPEEAYTNSLFASSLPFASLWQIITSDYIAKRRTEQASLFTYQVHRIEIEEWTSLGSVPIIDAEYLLTNVATLIVLIITLGFLTFLVGVAIRKQPQEELKHDSTTRTQYTLH